MTTTAMVERRAKPLQKRQLDQGLAFL